MAKVSLRGVEVRGCSKPNCRTGASTLNRHHKKHQAMFIGVWAIRRKGEAKWRQFVDRYHEYRDEDCCLICVNHHAEIHSIYDEIIRQDIAFVGRSLANYSWEQAERLMRRLEIACDRWLDTVSPGISPRTLNRWRSKRRRKK